MDSLKRVDLKTFSQSLISVHKFSIGFCPC